MNLGFLSIKCFNGLNWLVDSSWLRMNRASDSRLMLDYVRVINFRIIIIINPVVEPVVERI